MKAPAFPAVLGILLVGCLWTHVRGVTITLDNQCSGDITAYITAGSAAPNSQQLSSGSQYSVDVGASWTGGRVWAGNPDSSQANLAEFTTVEGGQDTYDISLVNAYNIGMEINPQGAQSCDAISCSIGDLQNFCQSSGNNFNSGSCINVAGPQGPEQPECCCSTSSTQAFKSQCPDAYTFSKDDASSTFHCEQASAYNIVFCPSSPNSNHNQACPQAAGG